VGDTLEAKKFCDRMWVGEWRFEAVVKAYTLVDALSASRIGRCLWVSKGEESNTNLAD
jgi:hypothetical protein